ncbi:MAG: type II toxin-antitoxin system RelE/ParE family toxin [Luteolibacter sp.]
MAFRVVWSETALADLHDLVRYIARDDRQVAKRFGDLIVAKVQSLQAFPRIGRIVPEYREDRLRELIMTPYRIVYEIDDEMMTLAILRIWHGARGNLELPP